MASRLMLHFLAVVVPSILLVSEAHAIQATLLCAVESKEGGVTQKWQRRIYIDKEVWSIEEEGRKDAKIEVVKGVTSTADKIFLTHPYQHLMTQTIVINRVSLAIEAIQTVQGIDHIVFSGTCKLVEFRPLRKL